MLGRVRFWVQVTIGSDSFSMFVAQQAAQWALTGDSKIFYHKNTPVTYKLLTIHAVTFALTIYPLLKITHRYINSDLHTQLFY